MERLKRPYSLHSRPTIKKNRRIFESSTPSFETKTAATLAALSLLAALDTTTRCAGAKQKLKRQVERREAITLAAYARGFWDQDAPFATDRAAHGTPC